MCCMMVGMNPDNGRPDRLRDLAITLFAMAFGAYATMAITSVTNPVLTTIGTVMLLMGIGIHIVRDYL